MPGQVDCIHACLFARCQNNMVDLSGRTPALTIAVRPVMTPSSVAERSLSAPQNLPKGVRTAERTTISFSNPGIFIFYRNAVGECYFS